MQQDDIFNGFSSNPADPTLNQIWPSLDFCGGFEEISSSVTVPSPSFLSQSFPQSVPIPLSYMSTGSSSTTTPFNVTPPQQLPTISRYDCLLEARNTESLTPFPSLEDESMPWPSLNYSPSDLIAPMCSNTSSEPAKLSEISSTPKRAHDVYPPTWSRETITPSTTNPPCGPENTIKPAAPGPKSSKDQNSQRPLYPTAHDQHPNNYHQMKIPSEVPHLGFGKLRTYDPTSKASRRERNSISARKYRQKRLDRIDELERALATTEKERDTLKLQLECWKTKAELLQELTMGSGGYARK